MWRATINTGNGVVFAFRSEQAFREEIAALVLSIPLAWFIGVTPARRVELVLVMLLLIVVELLNTAIEAVEDRVGLEWHPLAKRAKDMGSAAVFLCIVLAACVWIAALLRNWLA